MEDLKAFEKFFAYELTFEEDPVDILNDILLKAKKYLASEEIEAIVQAYEFTKEAHKGVLRKS
jgi:(p)ppGpp synthase/HD superfamily hydrolase